MLNKIMQSLNKILLFCLIPYFAMFIGYIGCVMLNFDMNTSSYAILSVGMIVCITLVGICINEIREMLKK
jgi:hypothetical protein